MQIKLVRHGESLANVGAVRGHEVGDHTIALTERGHAQARAAGARIGTEFLDGALVYASPFLRTRQTLAGILAGAGGHAKPMRVVEDPRLREVEHGYFDVREQRELQRTHGAFYYRFRGGESPADCYDRASIFLESLLRHARRREAERVLIVAHGLMIRCFVMRYFRLTVEQFEMMENPNNCDVVTIAARDTVRGAAFHTTRWAVSGLRVRSAPEYVDRNHAAAVAGAEIKRRGLGTGIRDVFTLDELREEGDAVPGATSAGVDLAQCWIVTAETIGGPGAPTSIVAVDRTTAKVVYVGSM